MKKINVTFLFLMILFAFGQIQAQQKIFSRYEDYHTKEAIFIEETRDNSSYPPKSTYKMWYSPKYMSDIQKIEVIKSPETSESSVKGLTFEVNIPKKGKCKIKDFFTIAQIIQKGKMQELTYAKVYVNPHNQNERIYTIGSDAIFYAQTGNQTPIMLKRIFSKKNANNILANKYRGQEFFMWVSSDDKLILENTDTNEKVYYTTPVLD